MITKIVIVKIIRAFFGKKEPVEVMIGFFDERGRPVGSQLVSAELFSDNISEGQSVDFKSQMIIQNLLESTHH